MAACPRCYSCGSLRAGIQPSRGELRAVLRVNGTRASLLLLPAVGFLPLGQRGSRSTIDAIERRPLVVDSSHGMTPATTDDGLPPGEGTFLACSFWLADAYAMTGRSTMPGPCSND